MFSPSFFQPSIRSLSRFVLSLSGLLVLTLIIGPHLGRAQQQSATNTTPVLYSHGDPTNDEQYLLTLLNRARMDPVGEGARIKAWLTGTIEGGAVIAQYGTDPDQVASAIAALPAVPPVAFNADLIASARAHSNDLAPHDGNGPNGDGHNGYDGSTPQSRVDATGYTGLPGSSVGYGGYLGENFDPGADSPDEIHAGYFVDWGNAQPLHRLAEMGTNVGVEIGIGLATKPTGLDAGNPLVETEDFGWSGTVVSNGKIVPADVPAELLGVVYTDANGNSQYDAGEGVAGATVTMDGGYYYAVTSASGGYALPLVNADGSNVDGPVTVHIALPNSTATRTATVNVSSYTGAGGSYRANVEWDVVTDTLPAANPSKPSVSGSGTVAKGSKLKLVVARPASSDLSQPMTVAYKLTGTAVANVDYSPLPGTVTIPAGKATAKIKVTALDNTVLSQPSGTTTLLLKLKGVAGVQGKATVTFEP